MAQPAREKTHTAGDWPDWLKPYAQQLGQLWNNQVVDPNTGQLREMSGDLNQQVAGFNNAQMQALSSINDITGSVENKDRLASAGWR